AIQATVVHDLRDMRPIRLDDGRTLQAERRSHRTDIDADVRLLVEYLSRLSGDVVEVRVEEGRGYPPMEIGFFFVPYRVALVNAMAEAAAAFGYDMVGIADTPGNAMDPWVATTLLASRTRRARVAVCVSNLVTRHPAVSAASIASIDLLAPGRAVLGIGVG